MEMESRQGFGLSSRSFSLTVSLQEGYEGGVTHTMEELLALLGSFIEQTQLEIGCEVIPTVVVYSYRDGGKMVIHKEPGAKLAGLFPPNKFGEASDEELAEMVGKLAAYLAGPLGQVSFHAQVCGKHFSWKRKGSVTAHEAAQRQEAQE